MRPTQRPPYCVHLLAHANPIGKDVRRFGFANTAAYLAFVRAHLPASLRLTYNRRVLEADENQNRGGRRDDAARIRDLQHALSDPATLAIVALSGGAYFSRTLPQVDFSVLRRRTAPLWAFGFSEMTSLVNLVAAYPQGRGVYWLCPNYLAWKVKPPAAARAAFAEFWRTLPALVGGKVESAGVSVADPQRRYLDLSAIRGRLVSGQVRPGRVRLIGGCLSVLAALLPGSQFRRVKPDGRWLILEDVNEAPYRIDRYLSALNHAGWFQRIAGVLVGDFHTAGEPQTRAAVEMLCYHLPARRNVPIVTTHSFGHTWPIVPVLLNRPLRLHVRGRSVTIDGPSDPT